MMLGVYNMLGANEQANSINKLIKEVKVLKQY